MDPLLELPHQREQVGYHRQDLARQNGQFNQKSLEFVNEETHA